MVARPVELAPVGRSHEELQYYQRTDCAEGMEAARCD